MIFEKEEHYTTLLFPVNNVINFLLKEISTITISKKDILFYTLKRTRLNEPSVNNSII
jgi:hypothetical protein